MSLLILNITRYFLYYNVFTNAPELTVCYIISYTHTREDRAGSIYTDLSEGFIWVFKEVTVCNFNIYFDWYLVVIRK